MIPETVRGGRAWGAGATLATGVLLAELCELLLVCEPVSLWELVELLGFEAGASLEEELLVLLLLLLLSPVPILEGELTDDDFVALQATKFIPTKTVRKTRTVFCLRLNRIRTTLYKHLNIGPLPESTGPHAWVFAEIVKISSQ